MPTTRPEQEQATASTQSDEYQPLGRQEAPTNRDALYGGNADDNSGSGGNAGPTNPDAKKSAPAKATDTDGNAQTDEQHAGAISGPGVSGGTGSSGTSSGPAV